MAKAVSPLKPAQLPQVPGIAGVRLATAAAGIRYAGRPDVLLVSFDQAATVAGVFTRSKCPSAPVEWCRARIGGGRARALVVNSGNANAFTGKTGRAATRITADLAAEAVGCRPAEVFLASTGVIGEPIDAGKFAGVMHDLAAGAGAAAIVRANDRRLRPFRLALDQVLGSLAEQVARDGEGASKLIEIVVEGAVSKRSARRIALAIANSPLVKTAVGGGDANW